MKLATPEAFSANPSRVWQFYHMRREVAMRANPNPAHMALANLCLPEYLRSLAPSAQFTLVTQNVDGLSTRALDMITQGRQTTEKLATIYEMHGRVLDTVCTRCSHRENDKRSPICEALGANADSAEEVNIPLDQLPRCQQPQCGGLLRPGVVWFGEAPHQLEDIDKVIDEADLCLVVGTSATVYPAAGYAYAVSENGGKVAIFNTEFDVEESMFEPEFLFLGPCEEHLPTLLNTTS